MKELTAILKGDSFIDTVELTLNEEGVVQKKIISVEEFQLALADNLQKKQTGKMFRMGRLPKGVFEIFYNDMYHNSFGAIIDVKGEKKAALLKERGGNAADIVKPYLIPYPNMVFIFLVKNGYLNGYVFCYKGELDYSSQLFVFPISNVSLSDGSICYGGNDRSNVGSIKELDNFIELFYGAPYNGDYYTPSTSTKANVSLKELMEMLSKEDVFPEEILVPADCTLEDVVVHVLK